LAYRPPSHLKGNQIAAGRRHLEQQHRFQTRQLRRRWAFRAHSPPKVDPSGLSDRRYNRSTIWRTFDEQAGALWNFGSDTPFLSNAAGGGPRPVVLFPHGELPDLLRTYGYGAIGGLVAFEGMGIPLPGETALVAAAILAGTDHVFDIWFVMVAAAAGAIFGDNVGFWLGREFGYRLLVRYGRYIRVTMPRIKLVNIYSCATAAGSCFLVVSS
jgi:hypothetical protein